MVTMGAVDGMHSTLWPFSRMHLCQTENETPFCIQKFYPKTKKYITKIYKI